MIHGALNLAAHIANGVILFNDIFKQDHIFISVLMIELLAQEIFYIIQFRFQQLFICFHDSAQEYQQRYHEIPRFCIWIASCRWPGKIPLISMITLRGEIIPYNCSNGSAQDPAQPAKKNFFTYAHYFLRLIEGRNYTGSIL